jgi:hypothetical protein
MGEIVALSTRTTLKRLGATLRSIPSGLNCQLLHIRTKCSTSKNLTDQEMENISSFIDETELNISQFNTVSYRSSRSFSRNESVPPKRDNGRPSF